MTPRVTVVGLGPAGPELVNRATLDAVGSADKVLLRTSRHPAATIAPGADSCDDLYESASTFEEVYAGVVERVVALAARHGRLVYAVPGSPRVAEATVEALQGDPRVELDVVPAMSFLDLVWDRVGVDPLRVAPTILDAACFEASAAGVSGPAVVAQCWNRSLLSDVKLAYGDDHPDRAVILHHLGLPDEAVLDVAWADLDRSVEPDHLTSLWVPSPARPVAGALFELAGVVTTLRARCPWDRAQTHLSLTRHLLEEAHEVLEAITEVGDAGGSTPPEAWDHLREELGDLLFQVYLHSTLAAEAGWFDLGDVAAGITAKLVARHPHVFGGSDAPPDWERTKQAEKGRDSLMDGTPPALPALARAARVQRKAASAGFDWPSAEGPTAKILEELDEVRAAAEAEGGQGAAGAELTGEVGDLLFSVVNLARHLNVDPETALLASAGEFEARFRWMEGETARAGTPLSSCDAAALDSLWERAKHRRGGHGRYL